jgi:hypothetical protein
MTAAIARYSNSLVFEAKRNSTSGADLDRISCAMSLDISSCGLYSYVIHGTYDPMNSFWLNS